MSEAWAVTLGSREAVPGEGERLLDVMASNPLPEPPHFRRV